MKTLFLLTLCASLATTSVFGATLKGTNGKLAGNWKLGIEGEGGQLTVLCEHPPQILFDMLTITCGENRGVGGTTARVDGPSGRLGGLARWSARWLEMAHRLQQRLCGRSEEPYPMSRLTTRCGSTRQIAGAQKVAAP